MIATIILRVLEKLGKLFRERHQRASKISQYFEITASYLSSSVLASYL